MTQVIELQPHEPNLDDYDVVCIAFSGGKDSEASLLDVIDRGVPLSKIVLMHHDVDGETSNLMDWPCTKAYCKAVAQRFDIPIYFSWKVGGFEGEMLRDNSITKPVHLELSTGETKQVGGVKGTPSTRLMFPQTAADLRTRWCSAYLKIDVGGKALVHDPLFSNNKVLFVTGERAQESNSRAKYKTFMPHMQDLRNGKKVKRHIDHWRNVHAWTEQQVWDKIKAHKLQPHPAYFLGWGRTSCLSCIFGSPNQWATIRKFMPIQFRAIKKYEQLFGKTINRTNTVDEMADKGTPYEFDMFWLKVAMAYTFDLPTLCKEWVLPQGAFGESNGPT